MVAAFGLFMDSAEFPATGIRTIAAQVTQFNIGRSQVLTNRFIDGEFYPLQNATIPKYRCGAAKVLRRKEKMMEDRYGQSDFQEIRWL